MSSGPSTNSSNYHPLNEEQVRDKTRKGRLRILSLFIALITLTGLEIYLLKEKTPIADNISVLLLFNVIIILLFLLIVLITRNLVKLYSERKSRILGSRFQFKLVLAFLTLALVPSLLLFFVASKLFSYSIGSWFSLQVEQSLQQSMEVAREYYAFMERKGQFHARQLETQITRNQLYLQDRRDQLNRLVTIKAKEYELEGILIFDSEGNVVVSSSHPNSAVRFNANDFLDLIGNNDTGEGTSELKSVKQGNVLAVTLPLTQTLDGKPTVWGYILTLSHVPHETMVKVQNIRNMFENYKKQSLLKLPVSANYFITFLMITLLILFSAIWLGFYMARGITVPIQQLAEGTRRVAEGDLSVQINMTATDEIGLLIQSFNQMTNDLLENREKFERTNEDLKTTNIELERRRYYIESVLENIGAGVVSIDKKGQVTTFNKAAKNILESTDSDILGSSYKDAFTPSFNDPIRSIIKTMNLKNQEFAQEQLELVVGENTLTLLVNVRFMRDDAGRYLGLLIVFEDLTQLIKAQKVAAWQEVAQGIAHEIKNPLTPIQLNTQRLKKKYYEDKKGFAGVFDESIKIITQEVEGMKQLLNEFLRFSRMPSPSFKPVSLHQVLEDVILLYRDHDKQITIVKQFDPNLHLMNLDPDQMRRVFLNLFENALDAVSENGTIVISTFIDSQAGHVNIEFADDGAGIESQDRDKLFLPHFTTKKRGTGLGLAIVNRIILDHNGIIQVRENEPKGTVFSIDLPYSGASAAPKKTA